MLLATGLLVFATDAASARRLRTNPNRVRYSTAAPIVEEAASSGSSEAPDRISVDTFENKFSFSDPAAENFKPALESDRKVSVI